MEHRSCEMIKVELESLDAFKSNIISKVSHEFRTPLVSIREFASIIQDEIAGPLTDNQKRYTKAIMLSIDRLARLVDNLLNVEILENRKISLKRKEADIKKLIEN